MRPPVAAPHALAALGARAPARAAIPTCPVCRRVRALPPRSRRSSTAEQPPSSRRATTEQPPSSRHRAATEPASRGVRACGEPCGEPLSAARAHAPGGPWSVARAAARRAGASGRQRCLGQRCLGQRRVCACALCVCETVQSVCARVPCRRMRRNRAYTRWVRVCFAMCRVY